MKEIILFLILSLISFRNIFAYGGQPPTPPDFVSSDINGPPQQPPLFIIDTNSVTIYTQLSFYSPSSIEGNITVEGTQTVRPANQNDKNFNWKIPVAALNAGISFNLGESQELFAALKIDSRESGISFSGGDLGLSFLIQRNKEVRGRLDFGLSYVLMDMQTILLDTDNSYYDTLYSTITNNEKGIGTFASLTIQTAYDDWIINPYLQVSYCRLPLFSIDNYSSEIYMPTNVVTVSPGITYKLGDIILLTAGGSYFIPSKIEDKSSTGIYSGFVQANFLF
jgi:hypothetical protein